MTKRRTRDGKKATGKGGGMKKGERDELEMARWKVKNVIPFYGGTMALRTDAGECLRRALHALYTGAGLFPVGIRPAWATYDGRERIIYGTGADEWASRGAAFHTPDAPPDQPADFCAFFGREVAFLSPRRDAPAVAEG